MRSFRFFIDTEFISHPGLLQLISIGVICENGNEFYEISKEFDEMLASEWVKKNVIKILERPDEKPRKSLYDISQGLLNFVRANAGDAPPEFWADYGGFDFVVVSHLFGEMESFPQGWPFYFFDLQQLREQLGIREDYLPKQALGQHNALADAHHNKTILAFLESCDK